MFARACFGRLFTPARFETLLQYRLVRLLHLHLVLSDRSRFDFARREDDGLKSRSHCLICGRLLVLELAEDFLDSLDNDFLLAGRDSIQLVEHEFVHQVRRYLQILRRL